MDTYFEQTVTAPVKTVNKIGLAAAWALLVVLAITAVIGLTNVLSVTEEGGLHFNLIALIVMAAAVALGIFVYRSKDKLNTEFDYIISENTLEVFGIYAQKRRKKLISVDIQEISAMGSVEDNGYRAESARPGVKKRSFVLNEDAPTTYICFRKENERVIALLEMNDELREYVEKTVRGRYGANYGANYGAIGGRN